MMDKNSHLARFLDAQNQAYLKALSEIKNGRKETHWMWYIFPQIKGLGQSETANFYGIIDLEEAENYLNHPVLGKHLIEISEAVLNLEEKSAMEIFGSPDTMKLKSSMTLFSSVKNSHPIFSQVLEKYFGGKSDETTLELLHKNQL